MTDVYYQKASLPSSPLLINCNVGKDQFNPNFTRAFDVGFWNVYGVMFEEVGTQCCWVLALPLRMVHRPRVLGRGELCGPWQGLGRISFPRTEIAPSFLLDNIVEILTATGVTDGQTGFSVWWDWTSGWFVFMGWNTIPKQHTCNCLEPGWCWCWEHEPVLVELYVLAKANLAGD